MTFPSHSSFPDTAERGKSLPRPAEGKDVGYAKMSAERMDQEGYAMDVKQEILRFADEKENNGALLLTGKWGCGKTFLLKESARELGGGGSCFVVFVSLFGICNAGEFHKAVKEKVFQELEKRFVSGNVLKKLSKYKTGAAEFLNIFGGLHPIIKGAGAVLSIDPYAFIELKKEMRLPDADGGPGKPDKSNAKDDGYHVEKTLLIFDDFERARFDSIVDLMGCINEYVEDKGIKTIVVADEDKISGGEYMEFKEKIISRTVRLTPDFDELTAQIIDSYQEARPGYSDFLKENLTLVQDVLMESGCENLRSLKALLTDFEHIYAAWEDSGVALEHRQEVFYMFGAMQLEYKSGNYEKSNLGYLTPNRKLFEKYRNWKNDRVLISLRNWIVDGVWDEAAFINELKRKYCVNEMDDVWKFLVHNFWDLEQRDIDKGLSRAIDRAYNGDMTNDELIQLLRKIFLLKKYSVPLPCEIDYARMESGLKLRRERILKNEIIDPEGILLDSGGEIERGAHALYNSIRKFEENFSIVRGHQAFVSWLRGDADVSEHYLRRQTIGRLDPFLLNLFFDKYLESDNQGKFNLEGIFLNFYSKKESFGGRR